MNIKVGEGGESHSTGVQYLIQNVFSFLMLFSVPLAVGASVSAVTEPVSSAVGSGVPLQRTLSASPLPKTYFHINIVIIV